MLPMFEKFKAQILCWFLLKITPKSYYTFIAGPCFGRITKGIKLGLFTSAQRQVILLVFRDRTFVQFLRTDLLAKQVPLSIKISLEQYRFLESGSLSSDRLLDLYQYTGTGFSPRTIDKSLTTWPFLMTCTGAGSTFSASVYVFFSSNVQK